MKKHFFPFLCLLALATAANAQTAAEKIIGKWTPVTADNIKSWNFAADSSGSTAIRTYGGRTYCNISQPFTWTISGDSIRIVIGNASAECTSPEGGSEANETSLSKRKAEEYSNKTYTYYIKFADAKNLKMGEYSLKKE